MPSTTRKLDIGHITVNMINECFSSADWFRFMNCGKVTQLILTPRDGEEVLNGELKSINRPGRGQAQLYPGLLYIRISCKNVSH